MKRTRLPAALALGAALGLTAAASSASAAPASVNAAVKRQAALSRAQGHLARNQAQAQADADHEFILKDVVFDADGAEHVRMDRLYKKRRVVGGDLVVHSDRGGSLRGMSQSLNRRFTISLAPVLDDADAVSLAHHGVG